MRKKLSPIPYKNFYNIQADAFGSLPVLNLFYNSRTHQDGWRYLIEGIAAREPFLLVTGDYGMGKTLLNMMLVRLLEKKYSDAGTVVQITDPYCGFSGILRQTAARLSVSTQAMDEQALLDGIYAYLNSQEHQQPLSIIIDDAQELEHSVLMRLRAFANFNRNGFFPLQLIFFAHPSFIELLKNQQLKAMGQRIKRRHRLQPLTFQETKEYIYFRLFKSGAPGTPSFTDDACREIFSSTGGIPRLINNICDASLIRGALKMEKCINRETIREAKVASGEQSRTHGAHSTFRPPPLGIPPQQHQSSQASPPLPLVAARRRMPALAVVAAACTVVCLAGFFLLWSFNPDITAKSMPQESLPSITVASEPPAIVSPSINGSPPVTERPTITESPPPLAPLGPATVSTDSATVENVQTVPGKPGDAPSVTTSDALIINALIINSTALSDFAPNSQAELLPVMASDSHANNRQIVSAPERPRPYTLKVACFNTLESAKNAATIYAEKSLTPFVVKVDLQEDSHWWIFYIGSFPNRKEAMHARKLMHIADAQVMPMPFACRIGVFGTTENIKNIHEKLEQLGVWPYKRANGDGTFSLFSGAFYQRAHAESLRQSLANKNIESTVTFLSAANPTQAEIDSNLSQRSHER